MFRDLVRDADVVVENFSAGTADRLGVGYETARDANPAIVYCSISGFGAHTDRGVPAMDTIIQALSGVMLSGGAEGDPPSRVGVPLADVFTPIWAVTGILAALHRRLITGTGDYVDVSMLGVVTSLVATEDWAALQSLGQPTRTGPTLPRLAPFGLYECRDGWVSIVAPQDKMVEKLFAAIGRPELTDDERFSSRNARVHHNPELTEVIEDWSTQRDTTEVVATLSAVSVAVAPVRDPADAVKDRRVTERLETVPVMHPTLGAIPDLMTSGIPLKLKESNVGFTRLAPTLGEHTDEVLGRLSGYDERHLQRLRDQGVI